MANCEWSVPIRHSLLSPIHHSPFTIRCFEHLLLPTQQASLQIEELFSQRRGFSHARFQMLVRHIPQVATDNQLGFELSPASIGLSQELNELRRVMTTPAFSDV